MEKVPGDEEVPRYDGRGREGRATFTAREIVANFERLAGEGFDLDGGEGFVEEIIARLLDEARADALEEAAKEAVTACGYCLGSKLIGCACGHVADWCEKKAKVIRERAGSGGRR